MQTTAPAKSRVLVFARSRPASSKERERGDGDAIAIDADADQVTVSSDTDAIDRVLSGQALAADNSNGTSNGDKKYVYDGCFDGDSSQKDVFSMVGLPVLVEVMKGFNGCVLAYGQTGSGKTYSLLNTDQNAEQAGLLPRLVATLFVRAAMDPKHVYGIEAAAFQVYNEQVDDLLHPQFHDRSSSNGAHNLNVSKGVVQGLHWTKCNKPTDMLQLFNRARSGITYAETKMNKASSRSHAAFQIKITKRPRATSSSNMPSSSNAQSQQMKATVGKLTVVDLAGSERVKKSGVTGANFTEATKINASLLALGNVIQALANKRKHVPFRDSKLTRILEGSVGGNCKTSLLVCVSPSSNNASETVSTLEFASRAMRVEVEATVNETIVEVDPARLAADLQANPAEYMDDDTLRAYKESEDALKAAKEQAKHHEDLATDLKTKMASMESKVSQKQKEIDTAKELSGKQVQDLRKTLETVEGQNKSSASKIKDLEVLMKKQETELKHSQDIHTRQLTKAQKESRESTIRHTAQVRKLQKEGQEAQTKWSARVKNLEAAKEVADKELEKLKKALSDLNVSTKVAQTAVAKEIKAKNTLHTELATLRESLKEVGSAAETRASEVTKLQVELSEREQELVVVNQRASGLDKQLINTNQERDSLNDQVSDLNGRIELLKTRMEAESSALKTAQAQTASLQEKLSETRKQLTEADAVRESHKDYLDELVCQLDSDKRDHVAALRRVTHEHVKQLEAHNLKHRKLLQLHESHAQEAIKALEVRAQQETEKLQDRIEKAQQEKGEDAARHQSALQVLEAQIEQIEENAANKIENVKRQTAAEIEQNRAVAKQIEIENSIRQKYISAAGKAATRATEMQTERVMDELQRLEQRFIARESRAEDLDLIRKQQHAINERDARIRGARKQMKLKELELDAQKQQDRIFGRDAGQRRAKLPGRYVGEHSTFNERSSQVLYGSASLSSEMFTRKISDTTSSTSSSPTSQDGMLYDQTKQQQQQQTGTGTPVNNVGSSYNQSPSSTSLGSYSLASSQGNSNGTAARNGYNNTAGGTTRQPWEPPASVLGKKSVSSSPRDNRTASRESGRRSIGASRYTSRRMPHVA